jgi:predicted RNA-binding Zn ribbon-like protein
MDYPRRGLPLPLELVNTTFASAGQPCDALTTPEDLSAWLRANRDHFTRLPLVAASSADLDRFRALREALRSIFGAVAAGNRPSATDIALVNGLSAAAPGYAHLAWLQRGPRLTRMDTADATTSLLGAVARAAIELLAGPEWERISRCQAPGCVLFFLREPRRRHWCSAACGNRARVARHYSRHARSRRTSAAERT